MFTRRQLIGSGMAVSTLGLGGGVATALELPASPAAHASHHLAACLIVDTRFDEARRIARQFARPGLDVIALPRDVLGLWHERLAPSGGIAPRAFAGVTTEHGFFALRTLAADHRLRVLHSTAHAAAHRDEALVSWVIGPAASRA